VIDFENRIDEIQSRDRCSRLVALQKAARQFPAEQQAYARAMA
jgi:hypothetical protein